MSGRNERFNNRMRSLDGLGIIHDRNRALSDHGIGVARMLDALDGPQKPHGQPLSPFERDLIQALNGVWLELGGRGHLVRTLDLICQNGRFRDESIQTLAGPVRYRSKRKLKAAERRYERQRALLEEIYSSQ